MLKFLIISIALSWIFSQLLKFFLKSKLKRFVDQVNNVQREETQKAKPKNGNVNVDYIPKGHQEKRTRDTNSIDGEYIDYVEVKD
ncbi:hypothetical protein EL17_14990 [Anditalea andensis]|uniref:DUF4834 domain-containing protein n=1 Tax=Anditalea andensis TaxID=1048983 RepID=A0A074KSI7_9BACT|nr:hypothetical protein EL17_14990 [Anditalea andensis]